MKKMKVAMIVTIIVTLAYAACLLLVNIPQEKNLILFGVNIAEIPFYVSPWWNLVLSPLVIIFITYAHNQEKLIGKEPKLKEGVLEMKYETRLNIYIVRIVSIITSLGTMVLSSLLLVVLSAFNINIPDFSPLSIYISGLICYIVSYIGLGISMQFITTILWKTSFDDQETNESILDQYISNFVSFVKVGLFEALPQILGMTIAFIFKIVFSTRITFNKNPMSR